MAQASIATIAPRALLPLAAALSLAACGSEEEPTYEPAATDVSGGELIVTDPTETGVPVEVPETPMTPVPQDSASPAPADTAMQPAPAAE